MIVKELMKRDSSKKKKQTEGGYKEILKKVSKHVEGNKTKIFQNRNRPICFTIAKPSQHLTKVGHKKRHKKLRVVCKKCSFGSCSRQNKKPHRRRLSSKPKHIRKDSESSQNTSPETQIKMEQLIDDILDEIDLDISSDPELCHTIVDQKDNLPDAVQCRSRHSSGYASPVLKQNAVSWAYEGYSSF